MIDDATRWSEATRQRTVNRRRVGVLAAVIVALLIAVVAVALDHGSETPAMPTADCHRTACTGEPGVSGAAINRAEVAARAQAWLDDTAITYSMTAGHEGPGGWGWYRRDCSGFVSMALRLPDDNGGASTVELADVVTEVPAGDLRPYDLIGNLGPGTAGESGHVQLFLGWADASHTRVRVAEQGGLTARSASPHEATYAWPERMAGGTVLRAYRYTGVRG